jgi:Family of unknown function (DUF5946)
MRPARAVLKRVGLRDDMIWPLARGVGPTVLPRPERFYFSFGEPLETTRYGGRNEGGRAARGLRDRVKRAVEDQIAFCLDERERDPSAISCRVSPPGSRPERVRSQSATATSCPGCGLVLPERRGPSHPYIGASPACWALYGEVLAREYGEQHYPRWHPLTVDSYVAQHPGEPERRTIRSVAVHLAGRCLAIEHDVPPERAGALIRELLARAPDFRWLDPLRAQAQSLWDVLEAADAADHAERVDQWARAVWKGAIGAPRDDQEVAGRAVRRPLARATGPSARRDSLGPQLARARHLSGIRTLSVGSGNLEQRGQVFEARLGEERPEPGAAELTLGKVGVAVAVRAERRLGVVHVQAAQAVEAHDGVELVDDRGEPLGVAHVVAAGEQMAAVEADPEPRPGAGLVDQLGELLKGPADRLTGAGRVLEQEGALGPLKG